MPSTSTRSRRELPDLSSVCLFCGRKSKNETTLVFMQYKNVLQSLKKKRCEEKSDTALKRKICGDFERLSADAK